MGTTVTLAEAATAYGVSPSQFRAQVAAGEAPLPVLGPEGGECWNLVELATRRPLALSDEQERSIRAEVARRFARGRGWEDGTVRQLVALSLSPREAQAFVDGTVLHDMRLDIYKAASRVLAVRVNLRGRLYEKSSAAVSVDEETLIRDAAQHIGEGSNVFEVLADLTVTLTSNGHAEVLMPRCFDPNFWKSQRSAASFGDYLLTLEKMWLPHIA
ncbi:hypothetical protein NLU66_07320 [Brachybacterium sp. NBEC-018]|uniref:hypothetical protein n=1 Tax=Brachybacterium sp. NBEC-018 TaxID=2996004 RepID=UPI0021751856|nr:hypothetical protein [Brachybacterium sp. NBEC-018]UVY85390.1 hypothetical protein NLU66_07320 [Brachybacterium sp. NBEC-018]